MVCSERLDNAEGCIFNFYVALIKGTACILAASRIGKRMEQTQSNVFKDSQGLQDS